MLGSGSDDVVPLSVDVEVPGETIANCCYYLKCVDRVHVMRIEFFAAKIAHRMYFTGDSLREILGVEKVRSVSEALRTALRRYVVLRLLGAGHEEAVDAALAESGLRVAGEPRERISEVMRCVFEEPVKIVRAAAAAGLVPATGWKLFRDETKTLAPLFMNKRHVGLALRFARTLPRVYTSLVFCGDDACYPAPHGIWPDQSWVSLAGHALRRDVVNYVLATFGALNIYSYILNNLDSVEDAAVSIKPGKTFTRFTLFLKVENPERFVVEVARFQETVRKLIEQLHALVSSDSRTVAVDYTGLGITQRDIAEAIRDVFFGDE